MSSSEITYAIYVRFQQQGVWSKRYVYKSKKPYKKGDVLIVPTGGFYGVCEAETCTDSHEFKPDKTYQWIIGKLHDLSYNPEDKFLDPINVWVKDSNQHYMIINRIEIEDDKLVITVED